MDNQQIEPTAVEGIQEPQEALSKGEINKQIEKYWKAIDQEEGYEAYFRNWQQLDYYRDLKQKLYK